MAGDALTPATAGDAAPAGAIVAYLATLERALPGRRRARAAILDEIRDGLFAAADRHRVPGADPAAAVQAALAEFGRPELVARAFADELAIAGARSLLTRLLLSGPLVGVWWLLLLGPHRWPPDPAELRTGIPIVPVVGAVVTASLGILAATGRPASRLPALSPLHTVRVAHGAAIACLVFDVVLLAQLAVIAAAAPTAHSPVLMAAAAAASLARLPWTAYASSGCRRSAAALSLAPSPP